MQSRDSSLRNQNKYISLSKAEGEVVAAFRKAGSKNFLSDPRMQKAREQWIAVGYGALVQKMTRKPIFLRMVPPEQEPPDVIFMLEDPKHGKRFGQALVEITEADPFSFERSDLSATDFVLSRIEAKIKSVYEDSHAKDMQLVVYSNISARIDLKKMREQLNKLKPPYSQIWIFGASEAGVAKVSLWEVWPGL